MWSLHYSVLFWTYCVQGRATLLSVKIQSIHTTYDYCQPQCGISSQFSPVRKKNQWLSLLRHPSEISHGIWKGGNQKNGWLKNPEYLKIIIIRPHNRHYLFNECMFNRYQVVTETGDDVENIDQIGANCYRFSGATGQGPMKSTFSGRWTFPSTFAK